MARWSWCRLAASVRPRPRSTVTRSGSRANSPAPGDQVDGADPAEQAVDRADHLEGELRDAVAEIGERQVLEHHVGEAAIGRRVLGPLLGDDQRVGRLVGAAGMDPHGEADLVDLPAVRPDPADAGDLALAQADREVGEIGVAGRDGLLAAQALGGRRGALHRGVGDLQRTRRPDQAAADPRPAVDPGDRVALGGGEPGHVGEPRPLDEARVRPGAGQGARPAPSPRPSRAPARPRPPIGPPSAVPTAAPAEDRIRVAMAGSGMIERGSDCGDIQVFVYPVRSARTVWCSGVTRQPEGVAFRGRRARRPARLPCRMPGAPPAIRSTAFSPVGIPRTGSPCGPSVRASGRSASVNRRCVPRHLPGEVPGGGLRPPLLPQDHTEDGIGRHRTGEATPCRPRSVS